MANHKSSKKRILRNANRAIINGARISRIRTFVKKVETAIVILHKNTVSRKISRLAARVKALAA